MGGCNKNNVIVIIIMIGIIIILIILHPTLSNKKASNKKLDSQISYFNKKYKDLITKSNKNSLLRNKKSRLSLEKSSFLLDRRECNKDMGGAGPPLPRCWRDDNDNNSTPTPIQ